MAKRRPKGTGQIFLRNKIWWIQYNEQGERYPESSGSEDRKVAEKLLHKRLSQANAGRASKGDKLRVADLFRLVIEDYEARGFRDVVHVQYRSASHLNKFFGKRLASQLSSRDIKRYVAERKQVAQPATINRELSILRRGYTLAVQEGLLERAPFIMKLEENNVRQGFLEHYDYLRLRDALPVHLRYLLVVLYHLGCRLGELRKLLWEQVDLDAREIRLPASDTKTKRPRTAPIYGEMMQWLEMLKADRDERWPDCPWVFNYHGRPIGHHVGGWNEACAKIGLRSNYRHDLRRTAVRNMERAGFPRSIAMSISGHSTDSIYRRYDIVSRKDLDLARSRMDRYLSEIDHTIDYTDNTVGVKVQ